MRVVRPGRLRLGSVAQLSLIVLAGAAAQPLPAQTPRTALALTGDLAPVHDPAIIKQGDTYYLFNTSQADQPPGLIHIRRSKDLRAWERAGAVFTAIPDWATKTIVGTRGIWAPDISFVNGEYRLYYSISTFGSNRSAIGLATSKTLDQSSLDYRWVDKGMVVESRPGVGFNAIDPNFVADREGKQWLSFGSFWTGIKLIALDPVTGKQSRNDTAIRGIASRPAPRGANNALEAPFIIERGGWYYQFVSYDYCCKGNASTYYTVVGRSKAIAGPYLDREGKSLMDGYGDIVLRADQEEQGRYRGPGHVAILRDPGQDYMVYHAYDREERGRPTLRIAPLTWSGDGWPSTGEGVRSPG